MKLIIDFILVVGVVLISLILFLLLKNKNKELSQKVLIVFYIFILFVNLHAYSCLHQLVLLFKISYLFDFVIFWLLGPLLLLYIKSTFRNTDGLIKDNLVHFIPTALLTISIGIPLVISLFFTSFHPEWLFYLEENQFGVVIFRNLYFLYYVKLSLDLLNKYKTAIKSNYSDLSNNDIHWIQKLLYGCAIFIVIDIITRFLDFWDIDFFFDIGYLTMFSIIFVTAYLGYYGVNQSKILLPDFLIPMNTTPPKRINSLSNYTETEIKTLITKLETVVLEKKSYLDENLNLNTLSKQSEITDKKLSTLLNNHMNTTFYDYINSFRVEAVKQALLSNEYNTYTLLGIALESGFNSKASFNRAFKKEMGCSPSQFRKENS